MSVQGTKSPPPLPRPDAGAWHYNHNGKPAGPVSAEKLRALYDNGALTDDTLVWNENEGGDWAKLSATNIVVRHGTPPLPANQISDRYIWAIATLPVIGALIEIAVFGELVTSPGVFIFYAIANGALATADGTVIQKAGRKPVNALWGFLLVPAYIFIRSQRLTKSYAPLAVWIAALLLASLTPSERVLAELAALNGALPSCEARSSVAQVKAIFPQIPMNVAGLPALDVQDIHTISSTSKMNTCEATIGTVGGTTFPVRYTIEDRDGQHWYYVNLIFN